MQLVNMDVDHNGTNQNTRLGPFSPGLNAICGPTGTGKTSLLQWLRQIAAEDFASTYNYPDPAWNGAAPAYARRANLQSPVSGSVEIRNRSGAFRLSLGNDGRVYQVPTDSNGRSWETHQRAAYGLSSVQRDVFRALASANGALDTEAALLDTARRLGLDVEVAQDNALQRQRLLDREQDLLRRAALWTDLRDNRDELLQRRAELEGELHRARHSQPAYRGVDTDDNRRLLDRNNAIEADLRSIQVELEQIDQQIAKLRAELKLHETGHHELEVGESYRSQLQQLDDRLNRWRQTLRDLKSHRERVEHNATDARLDKQIGDQLSTTKESDPRAALRSLEAQIVNTRQQLDQLVDRYAGPMNTAYLPPHQDGYGYAHRHTNHNGYAVQHGVDGQTHIATSHSYAVPTVAQPDTSNLPETLRVMQKDLHEVCQQLARHEATAAAQTLKAQSQQLQRCETELLQSVEKLIDERAELLRRIADEQHISVEQLTLAFGEWCQCHDHPHLHDWLMNADSPTRATRYADSAARQDVIDELERLTSRRKQINLQAEECRRQLRDAELLRRDHLLPVPASRGRGETEILHELDRIVAALNGLDERERVRVELDDVRRQLSRLPTDRREGGYRACVDRHILGLMDPRRTSRVPGWRTNGSSTLRQYDHVDGVIEQPVYDPNIYRSSEMAVPKSIVRLAMRLAIVEAMAARGEPVCLVLDQTLDGLPVEVQQSSIHHLAHTAADRQQIIVMTADEHVAILVRGQHGYVGYLSASRPQPLAMDINRQLTAYANELESEKWYQPIDKPRRAPRPETREYYLHDRSLIEELPSIDATAAARCRSLGVDRIGDLLDVDPVWLAEHMRMDGISKSTVTRWQAEARLLCSVRKLRPFDARVLVGAGIRTPQQLSEVHPSQLLDRVENFLATDRGRSILRSGNSYELSRITTWIASAKSGSSRYQRTSLTDDNDSLRSRRRAESEYDRETGREYARDYDYDRRSSSDGSSRGYTSSSNGSTRTSSSRRSRRNSRKGYPTLRSTGERSYTESSREPHERASRSRDDRARRPVREYERATRAETVRLASTHVDEESSVRLKFYLELSSPVVDAPSIGPRMASRLEKFGILTVDQLLAASADTLADKLNLRRVDPATIRGWQEQARLVCRIPNLRGHDAQLLVACDLTSPEELANMDAQTVLAQVLAVAQTTDGQRILRGGKEPDLAEVTDWIAWAGASRSLNAA
ncbi:MAG: DUF4332 domain-containing protein [Pirellulaceae bacterium]